MYPGLSLSGLKSNTTKKEIIKSRLVQEPVLLVHANMHGVEDLSLRIICYTGVAKVG